MLLPTKVNKARAALHDDDVLALMRADERFAEYFDDDGALKLDVCGEPSLLHQIREAANFNVTKLRDRALRRRD